MGTTRWLVLQHSGARAGRQRPWQPASPVALTWQAPAMHLPLSRPRVLARVQSPALGAQPPLGWHVSHCASQRSSAGAAALLHPIACKKGSGGAGGGRCERDGMKRTHRPTCALVAPGCGARRCGRHPSLAPPRSPGRRPRRRCRPTASGARPGRGRAWGRTGHLRRRPGTGRRTACWLGCCTQWPAGGGWVGQAGSGGGGWRCRARTCGGWAHARICAVPR